MWRIVLHTPLLTLACFIIADPATLIARGILRIDGDVIFTGSEDAGGNEPSWSDASRSWPQVTPDKRPALVSVEGQPGKEHLCLAYLHAGTIQKEEIASAKYITPTQLDRALFLVEASEGRETPKCFAVDLERGIARLLGETSRLHCLRTVPERGRAMLIHSHAGIGEMRLLELDLKTLDMTLQHVLTKAPLGARFAGIGPHMRISPDFRRVAYVARGSGTMRDTTHALNVMDLTTTESRCFAEGVRVRLGWFSSIAFGRPPLEWINNEEIVYQHMPREPNAPGELHQGTYILNRVNLTTRTVTTVLQDQRPLTTGGGSLWVNPLNGELVYNDTWILDLGEGTLTAKHHPYSIEAAIQGCSSASHLHFAYALRSQTTDARVTIYMKLNGKDEPLEAGSGPYWPTRPIGWIE